MKNKKSNNLIKYVLFTIVGIFVLVIVLPLLGGIISGVNPSKSVQMAQEKTMQDNELSLPEGYSYLSKAEVVDLGEEKIYVTKISDGKFTINLIKQSVLPECSGTEMMVGNLDVCMNSIKDRAGLDVSSYTWESNSGVYQIDVPSDSISQDELEMLLLSI